MGIQAVLKVGLNNRHNCLIMHLKCMWNQMVSDKRRKKDLQSWEPSSKPAAVLFWCHNTQRIIGQDNMLWIRTLLFISLTLSCCIEACLSRGDAFITERLFSPHHRSGEHICTWQLCEDSTAAQACNELPVKSCMIIFHLFCNRSASSSWQALATLKRKARRQS